MYCPDKLKLNKFIHVRIPDNVIYFGRVGQVQASPELFSGEEEVLPTMRQKLDSIAEEFDRWREYVDSHSDFDEKNK